MKRTKLRLKLAETGCQSFLVTIYVPENRFKSKAFLAEVPLNNAAEVFEKGLQLRKACRPKRKETDYAAEVIVHKRKIVDKRKDEPEVIIHIELSPKSKAKISNSKANIPGKHRLFAEEIFQWFRQFIADDSNITIYERVEFEFPRRQFESVFSLPLQLSGGLNTTGSPIFEDSRMVGVRVRAKPNQTGITSLEEEVSSRSITVRLRRYTDTNPAKLLTLEADVSVLYNVATKSAVRQVRKTK